MDGGLPLEFYRQQDTSVGELLLWVLSATCQCLHTHPPPQGLFRTLICTPGVFLRGRYRQHQVSNVEILTCCAYPYYPATVVIMPGTVKELISAVHSSHRPVHSARISRRRPLSDRRAPERLCVGVSPANRYSKESLLLASQDVGQAAYAKSYSIVPIL